MKPGSAGAGQSTGCMRLVAIGLLASALALTVLPTSASGHHGGRNMFVTGNTTYNTCVAGPYICRSDNSALTIHKSSNLNDTQKGNIDYALDNWYEPTDLTVERQSPAVTSGLFETDILYNHSPNQVPQNLDGITYCDDPSGAEICDQFYIYFRTVQRSTACHETGHGVGLTHGDNAAPKVSTLDEQLRCLTTPAIYEYLGNHNQYWIDYVY